MTKKSSLTLERSAFPDDFIFGVATSAYQIEGQNFGKAGLCHWDTFATIPGRVSGGETGALACDHYHRYEEDLDLIAAAGFDSYRFSTSWARIMPDGVGKINEVGLDFYDRLVDGMLAREIKPAATLYHWELPAPLAELGGWRNPEISKWFADFSSVVIKRLGDRLYSVSTINEPWCVTWLSHFLGVHAPGLKDIHCTAQAMHNVLLAHGRSISAMRGLGMQNLGIVCNFEYGVPVERNKENIKATTLFDAIYNKFFLGGLFKKKYPVLVTEFIEPYLPKNWQDDFDIIGSSLDWFGVNYYTKANIRAAKSSWPSFEFVTGSLPRTDMGWEIFPEGLSRFLKLIHEDYTKVLPLYVTENGMANKDKIINGSVNDENRIFYIDQHLHAAKTSIIDGVPLKGFYIWSGFMTQNMTIFY